MAEVALIDADDSTNCLHCGANVYVEKKNFGKDVTCPSCGKSFPTKLDKWRHYDRLI